MKKTALLRLLPILLAPSWTLAADRFAQFPVAIKMSATAKVGNTVYVGLGTAGHGWYALDTARPGAQWRPLAPFPDQPRQNANAVAVGNAVYVFNGQGQASAADTKQIIFDTVWKYDIVTDSWSRVMTRSPLGGLASAATILDGHNILFFGGVNKAIFDGYFIDAAAVRQPVSGGALATDRDQAAQEAVDARYFTQRPQDYLFTAQVLSYNPADNQWRNLGIDPYAVTVGAGLAVKGTQVTLVGGEIKPGLRSPYAKSVTVTGDHLRWHGLSPLVAAPGEVAQEGLGGAFAGYSKGVLLTAGGANFPGAWRQFNAGSLFAHKGLQKTWRADIYAFRDGAWRVAGALPAPMGYGSYVQLDDGVLVVGGELQGGAGSKDVFLMMWNGKSVDIVR